MQDQMEQLIAVMEEAVRRLKGIARMRKELHHLDAPTEIDNLLLREEKSRLLEVSRMINNL